MRGEYFFGFILSFTAGIAIESLLGFGYSFSIFFTALSLFIYLIGRGRHYSKNVFLVSLVLLGVALVFLMFEPMLRER